LIIGLSSIILLSLIFSPFVIKESIDKLEACRPKFLAWIPYKFILGPLFDLYKSVEPITFANSSVSYLLNPLF